MKITMDSLELKFMTHWSVICALISYLMMAVVIASSILLFLYSSDADSKVLTYMISMYAGMLVCAILFISVWMDKRLSKATFYFMSMISLEFFNMLVEFIFWHMHCYPPNDAVLYLIYYVENIAFPSMLFLFGHYQKNIMNIKSSTYTRINYELNALLAVNALLLISNVPTGWLFSVSNGVYTAGAGYMLMFISPLLMIILCGYTTFKYGSDPRHKFSFSLYLFLPLFTILMKLPYYSSSVTFLTVLVSLFFMYGEVYLNRGLKLVKNEAILTERKIAMMISRIEPEFLEEILKSIESIESNPSDTRNAISNFRKYLGENVSTITITNPIPLEQELAHVRTYVDLEKLRFKEKLEVTFEIHDRDFLIPPMTLQMIVENAIKHGVTQREEGGTVKVTTELIEEYHVITVTDNGVGFDTTLPFDGERSHVGLENIMLRLKNMVNGKFEITSAPGVGTTAIVRIPRK